MHDGRGRGRGRVNQVVVGDGWYRRGKEGSAELEKTKMVVRGSKLTPSIPGDFLGVLQLESGGVEG